MCNIKYDIMVSFCESTDWYIKNYIDIYVYITLETAEDLAIFENKLLNQEFREKNDKVLYFII